MSLSKQFQPLPDFDIHDARRASSLRVLDVWANLAERHSRRLDEDDIVDLLTGDVVKDRGVLRGSFQQYDIGCFADAEDPASGNNDASSDGAEEDDVDELDSFTEQADISGELAQKERINRVPPVQVMDPEDAQDLREFLAAEKQRNEAWGAEEVSSSSDDLDGNQDLEEGWEEGGLGKEREEEEEHENAEEEEAEAEKEAAEVVDDFTPDLHTENLPQPPDEESDDELGTWDLDEGNTVYQVSHHNDVGAEDDTREIELDVKSNSEDPIIISSPEPSKLRSNGRSTSKTKDAKMKTPKVKLKKLYVRSDSEDMSPAPTHMRARKRKRVLSEELSGDGAVDDSKGETGGYLGEASSSSSFEFDKPLPEILGHPRSRLHTAYSASPSNLQTQTRELSYHPHSHLQQHTPQLRSRHHPRSKQYPAHSQSDPIPDPFSQAPQYPTPFAPIQDPRAQFIISQAMRQLSSLMAMTGPSDPSQPQQYPWAPPQLPPTYPTPSYPPCQNPHCTPFTPSQCRHHTHPSSSASSPSQQRVRQSSVVYATPTYPRSYPYTPSLSEATLPPSSPDPSSSPPRPSVSETRAKSLVRRSKSRGRRVSFRIQHERSLSRGTSRSRSLSMADMSEWEIDVEASPIASPVSRRGKSVKTNRQTEPGSSSMVRGRSKSVKLVDSPPRPTPRSKGKVRVETLEGESDTSPLNPHRDLRGQTPGPPARVSSRQKKLRSRGGGKPGPL